jgi:hypothetical protein
VQPSAADRSTHSIELRASHAPECTELTVEGDRGFESPFPQRCLFEMLELGDVLRSVRELKSYALATTSEDSAAAAAARAAAVSLVTSTPSKLRTSARIASRPAPLPKSSTSAA